MKKTKLVIAALMFMASIPALAQEENGFKKFNVREDFTENGFQWFKTAPMYIIASILHDEEWVRGDGKHHGNIDIAIAVEHLCLAATEQGLATCWVCNFDANLCKEQFGLPENEEPAVIIPLGYAADEMKPKQQLILHSVLSSSVVSS